MIDQLTPMHMLYLCLSGVAIAGILVGWFARRILSVGQYNSIVAQVNTDEKETGKKLASSLKNESSLTDELDSSAVTIANFEMAAAEHANEKKIMESQILAQAKRVNALESQAAIAEEQYVRGQRDFAKMRLLKAREVQRLQQQLGRVNTSENESDRNTTEDDLPVLNKRAGSRQKLEKKIASGAAAVGIGVMLPDITNADLESDEDVFDMTSEFDFDADELLAPMALSLPDEV